MKEAYEVIVAVLKERLPTSAPEWTTLIIGKLQEEGFVIIRKEKPDA